MCMSYQEYIPGHIYIDRPDSFSYVRARGDKTYPVYRKIIIHCIIAKAVDNGAWSKARRPDQHNARGQVRTKDNPIKGSGQINSK